MIVNAISNKKDSKNYRPKMEKVIIRDDYSSQGFTMEVNGREYLIQLDKQSANLLEEICAYYKENN